MEEISQQLKEDFMDGLWPSASVNEPDSLEHDRPYNPHDECELIDEQLCQSFGLSTDSIHHWTIQENK